MADSVRIEIAFDGGQVMGAIVTVAGADELERVLAAGNDQTYVLDATEGRYTIALGKLVWVKRYARESRVGFGI
ncbi:MAG: hypothetical protein ACR2GT_09310 [Gaiellaceae bacterium]